MNLYFVIYFALAIAMLGALTWALLQIGERMSDCPVNGNTIKALSLTVATGFAAVGLGGVTLLAIMIPMAVSAPLQGFLGALGIAFVGLGFGFSQALSTMRDAVPGNRTPNLPARAGEPGKVSPALSAADTIASA